MFAQSLAIPFYPEGNWHEYWTFVYIWWGRWKAKKYKGLQAEESLGRNPLQLPQQHQWIRPEKCEGQTLASLARISIGKQEWVSGWCKT